MAASRLPPTTRLEIRTSEPGSKRAAELVRSFPPPEEDGPFASIGAEPPLLAEGPAPVPVGHLSYSALALYEQCGYRFYVERVLGAREALAPAPGEPAEEPPEIPDRAAGAGRRPRTRARDRQRGARGARVERTARLARAVDDELLERLLGREGLAGDAEALARARRLVGGWLGSDLRAELAGVPRAEVPFVLGLAARSCAARSTCSSTAASSRPSSTTRPTRSTAAPPAEAAARYAAQRQVYALAVGGETGPARSTSSSRRPTSRRSSSSTPTRCGPRATTSAS